MTLTDIPAGSAVYIDANIFVYHFAGASPQCREFLRRVESGDIQGYTGALVLLEVVHRLMILEAVRRGLVSASRPSVRLASRPDVVQQLSHYQGQALRIPEMGVRVLELPRDFLARSFEFRQQFGLLTNDSVIALQMRDMGLRNLASADQNFDRAQGILRFGPSDLEEPLEG